MQLCGQYGHPALAVKVNESVDYFLAPLMTLSYLVDNLCYRSLICHANFRLRDGKGDTVDKRVNHEIAKEGTFSRIKTYDSFNFYRFFGSVISARCVTFQGKISFLAKISAPSNLNLVDLFIGTNFGKLVIKIVFNRFSKLVLEFDARFCNA